MRQRPLQLPHSNGDAAHVGFVASTAESWAMRILVSLFIALIAIPAFGQAPVRGGPLPAPLPLFPLTNWWNADITQAPVDANSAAFIAYIGPSRGMHPDFGGDSDEPEAPIYGMPYIVVSGSQPLVPVTFEYDDESDAGAPGRPPPRSRDRGSKRHPNGRFPLRGSRRSTPVRPTARSG